MIIAIDFDGTIVTHAYPIVGEPVPYAIETMQELLADGYNLILWTMRSGKQLDEAVDYCGRNGIGFWGINKNPNQGSWTQSPKAYAPIYIDDAALGCPLIYPREGDKLESVRPYVDWPGVRRMLGMYPIPTKTIGNQ